MRSGLGAAALLAMLAAPAAAQQAPAGNVANGKRLALAGCATCHVVERDGRGGWTDAPSFAAIAARRQVNRAWLGDFFGKRHLDMMYTDRPPQEAADISAYILSLKPR